jgi:hypothetical protein
MRKLIDSMSVSPRKRKGRAATAKPLRPGELDGLVIGHLSRREEDGPLRLPR